MAIRYLPPFLLNDKTIKQLYEAIINETTRFGELADDLLLTQRFVETATWGLSFWEKELGIRVDENKPIEERRSNILAKLRSVGTVTKPMIDSVADGYAGTEVEVFEESEIFNIRIKFVGTRGIPSNLDDMKKSMREIIPAHLTISYEFTYLIFNELDNQTWNNVESRNLTWDMLETTFFE